MDIFINNKDLISRLNQSAMAYMPAIEIDIEINLLSNTYYSSVMSILHFGEGELNFRKGERYKVLNLSPQITTFSNEQLKLWNSRGIETLDRSIKTIEKFMASNVLSDKPVPENSFKDLQNRVADMLSESQLKPSDVLKLMGALNEVIKQATLKGELGVITYMRDKLVSLKAVRLSPSRGTEDNIPVWKLIGAIVLFGFPVYKSLRCILTGKCCNTVSGLEGMVAFIATVAITLC
jgi:hypothetical protein